MTTQPCVGIVKAADRTNANLVWAAWGKGPGTFSRKLTDDPAPTPASTVTHYLFADSSTSVEDVQIIQGFANGDLPPLQPGAAWGVDGAIEAADALAAIDGDSLQCYSASGNVTPVDHVSAILASRGLSFVPDDLP
jgi:microcystin degradation protein MlrC